MIIHKSLSFYMTFNLCDQYCIVVVKIIVPTIANMMD